MLQRTMPVSYTHLDVYKRQTRARTENEDDMILACLAHCAGKPVCVCAQNGDKAGNWLFPLPAEGGAVHGAALCSVLGIPEDAALAGAERLTRSLALRLPEPVSYTHLDVYKRQGVL